MKEAALMIRCGFDVASEPYLKSVLLCLRAHLLQVHFSLHTQRKADSTKAAAAVHGASLGLPWSKQVVRFWSCQSYDIEVVGTSLKGRRHDITQPDIAVC
jgi:hypothetical protein